MQFFFFFLVSDPESLRPRLGTLRHILGIGRKIYLAFHTFRCMVKIAKKKKEPRTPLPQFISLIMSYLWSLHSFIIFNDSRIGTNPIWCTQKKRKHGHYAFESFICLPLIQDILDCFSNLLHGTDFYRRHFMSSHILLGLLPVVPIYSWLCTPVHDKIIALSLLDWKLLLLLLDEHCFSWLM